MNAVSFFSNMLSVYNASTKYTLIWIYTYIESVINAISIFWLCISTFLSLSLYLSSLVSANHKLLLFSNEKTFDDEQTMFFFGCNFAAAAAATFLSILK